MTNYSYVRSALALAALELAPPMIRMSLLEEVEFREEYGLKADGILTFRDSGVSIQRSELYEAIREILSGASDIEVTDNDGGKWELKDGSKEGELPFLFISRNKQRFNLLDYTVFSSDYSIRLCSLDEKALDVNLPTIARDAWRNILSERALDDYEIDEFHSDFRETPVHIARSIRSANEKGEISIFSLIPTSRKYFERLVGRYDGSSSIRDFATVNSRRFIGELSAWRPYDGFLFSLLMSSHSALTAEIGVEHLENVDLVRALDFLGMYGDRISQLGAIEVGLRVVKERPEIEPAIIRLIEQIQNDDVDGSASGFKLLSALFILVDGELSRTRLFPDAPPFYRRLASLSQAALIHRQFVSSGVEIDRLCEWAFNSRGGQYYMQSFADMRMEPCWNPDLATASQMKADFLGRIIIAAINYEKNISGGELHDLVLGNGPDSLLSIIKYPNSYFPGPLEGAEGSQNILPVELSENIEKQLGAEEVGPSSFIALVNSVLLFRVESDQAQLAARALKLGSYRLANLEYRSQLLAILNGLALVAATTRNSSLANELKILVRRYRHDAQYAVSIDEALKICLLAAASRTDLIDWRDFAGDWLTELAFGKLEGNDGEVLYTHLQNLFIVVPELWVSCGRADAALKAYNASQN